ncbi:MAG: hypothetical protein R3F48_14640 [Candidatus Zixiibacteriota bacterium]
MLALSRFDIEFLGSYLWLSVLICVGLLVVTYIYYRRTTPPLAGWLRGVLAALRIIAFVALFLALTQPILTIENRFDKKKSMAVIIDRSKSMDLPASQGADKSRADVVNDVLQDGSLSALFNDLDVTYYAVAESLDVNKNGLNLSGNKTDFGKSLIQLKQLTALNPPEYMMLISDGRVTTGEEPADVIGQFGAPALAIAVGDSSRINDLLLDNVLYNDVIYAGRQTEFKAVVSQTGEVEGDRRVTLREGNQVLGQATLRPQGEGRTVEETVSFTPSQPGKKILTMEISGDDTNENNNRKTFAVRILKSKLSILLYTSSVNEEYAFLNRYLRSRDDFEVESVIDANGGDRLGIRFPNTAEKLNSYDAVILIDPDLNRLQSHYDKFVSYLNDRGGGLFVLMGEKYAASANGSRIEGLLPLAVSNRRMAYGKYQLAPNPRMIFHPAVKLGETREEIARSWQNLPPFTALVTVDSLRSSGVPLAYIEGNRSRREVCGLALQRMGAGKIIALALSPLWNWAFYPVGVGDDASDYKEFISGSLRWLTIGDESDRVNFKPVAEVFESGDAVIFEGIARDEGFRPIEGGSGEVVIVSASGDSTTANILPQVGREAGYFAEFGVMPPGEYNYRADMFAEGVRLGRFDGKFAIDNIDRETALTAVDWNSLARTASVSGGVFAPYTNLQPIIDAIDVSKTDVTESHEVRLWNHVILLIIILVALSAEWFIRKNRQLL